MKEKIKFIDPPSGWKYGFPKRIPEDIIDVNKWLIENGYPETQISYFGDSFYCRFWYQEENNKATSRPDDISEEIKISGEITYDPFELMNKTETEFLIFCFRNNFEKREINDKVVYDLSVMQDKFEELVEYLITNRNWERYTSKVTRDMTFGVMVYKICMSKINAKKNIIEIPKVASSNSKVFEHYGKPLTSGSDLWDFLAAHYNFTPKT